MICPCKDCKKKGCGLYHSQCEDYLNYTKWKKAVNEEERKSKLFNCKIRTRRRRNQWWKN